MTQVKVLVVAFALAAALLLGGPPAVAADAGYAQGDMAVGAADAPVTVIEYASMTCPHCANFHLKTFKELKAKYIDTGQVRMIFREFPFDPLALQASMLARCAGEKRYFGMIEVLFRQQAKWAQASNPQAVLAKIARLGGISKERFESCMGNRALADVVLKNRLEGNKKYGVDSTPSFIVNGKKTSGAMTMIRVSGGRA